MTELVCPAPSPGAPRVSVRRRLSGGGVGDVVGHLLGADATGLLLLPQDGPAVRVDAADVLARRVVPPRPVRPASSPAEVQRLTSRGWPGLEQARLGGWLLRAGQGWTSRANSCLVAGDPGAPLEQALGVVVDWYRARGLPPRVDLPFGSQEAGPDGVGDLVDAWGWQAGGEALVLVADLRRVSLPDPAPAPPGTHSWATRPDRDWLSLMRGGQGVTDPRVGAVLTSTPAHYLTVRDVSGPVACGRMVRTDDWAGLGGIEVAPLRRGAGWGRVVTAALLARAHADGARFAYAQVEVGNTAARGLYLSLGFTDHHRYHYRSPGRAHA